MLPAPVSPDFSHKPGRVMQPGFGGKLHPRRQGHAGFASVVEAGRFPLPKELRLPASAARSDNAEAKSKPCWMQVPIRSRSSVPACAGPSDRGLPNLLRGLPTRNLRTPFGVLRPEFRTPLEVLHSELPLRFRKSFRFPITSGHPRSGPCVPPEGCCTVPARVSSWSCFGFPRRDRLLTDVKLSLIGRRGKGESAENSCG